MPLKLNDTAGQGKSHSPYSWHTAFTGVDALEQAHAESEGEQIEPAEFRQVDPVPQNWAEGPARQKVTKLRARGY